MDENMTDKQLKTFLEMLSMVLDGCKDINEAKDKVNDLMTE